MRWSKRSQAATSPETFQVTASKLGDFSPENVLVFENAANGIKAANSAGMPCILLSDCSLMDDLYEYDYQPTLIIKNYSEFSFDSFTWEPPNQKKQQKWKNEILETSF